MADEVINKLGFDVSEALSALSRLDNSLRSSATGLQGHARQLDAWNGQARAALATMRELAGASVGVKMPVASAAGVAAKPAAKQLWLPPGLETKTKQAAQSMDKLKGAAKGAGTAVTNAGKSGGKAMAGADKNAKALVTSVQMLGRIVVTQAIVRALSVLRDAFREALQASIEFQKSMSETLLLTLDRFSNEATSTFASLSAEAAEMSKSFNIPLPDVAEGLYQTISNQFVTTAERASVMEASMKLARVGVMDLKDSVLLVTGVLNSYGMTSDQAAAVSAKLFRTIQLGRVRGEELANTLGAVTPVAAQLGVSLNEVLAAYTSMTIGGLNAHKTATSLRQSMLAFIKPSEDMKRAFRELGYANADQIIQAEGFVGALGKIADASRGMVSEQAKMIRRVRALTGALSLGREDFAAYEKALAEMALTTSDNIDALYAKFKEMPAEHLTHQINELKTTLTQDFGRVLVDIAGQAIQFVGGAQNMAAALQGIAAMAAVAGAALAVLAAKALLAQMTLGPLGAAMLVLTAVLGARIYQKAKEIAAIREAAEAERGATREKIKSLEEVQAKQREAARETRVKENQEWQKGMAGLMKVYFKTIDKMKDKNKELVDSARLTTQAMINSQGRVVAAYRNAAKAAADAVVASRQRQISVEAQYSDKVFQYVQKNKQAYEQANAYLSRAASLARKAQQAMSRARTPDQIQAALDIFRRADAAAQEAEQFASGTKNVMLQEDAQRMVLAVMRKKIEAEKDLQQIQAVEAQRLAQKAAAEQKRLNGMKKLSKEILDDLQLFTKEGPKDPLQLGKQQERLEANLKLLQQAWLGGKQIDVEDILAFDQLQQRVQTAIEGGVTKAEIKKLYSSVSTFAEYREQIEKGVGPVRTAIEFAIPKLPKGFQEELEGLSAEDIISVLSQRLKDTNEIMDRHAEMAGGLERTNVLLDESMTAVESGLQKWMEGNILFHLSELRKKSGTRKGRVLMPGRRDAIDNFYDQLQKFTQMPKIALETEDFQALNEAYKKYLKSIKPSKANKAMLENFMRDAASATEAAESAAKLREGLGTIEVKALEAGKVRPILQQALEAAQSVKEASDSARRATSAAANQVTQAQVGVQAVADIDMTGLVGQVGQLASAMWDAARASQQIKIPSGGEYAARGGRVGRYLAAGGPAGTDVVPSWLSRGEFVMNAAATTQFASQLVAMNAGVQPNFRSDDGSVTNIGDINVSVKGGDSGRQTARSIAVELRRELRRGTTTL